MLLGVAVADVMSVVVLSHSLSLSLSLSLSSGQRGSSGPAAPPACERAPAVHGFCSFPLLGFVHRGSLSVFFFRQGFFFCLPPC